MKPNLFVAGQRWISTTELELGLGIVAEVLGRQVRMLFPACGEERTYASHNSPLSRLLYAVGDQICDRDGQPYTVTAVTEEDGRCVYQVANRDGELSTLPEQLLDSHAVLRRPQERLFSGQIDRNASFELRAATLEQLHRLQSSPAHGLLGPRVQLLPHQLYIASEVSARTAPRVLLADEVGLGKTIEAGLILHQQLVSGRAERALVVVPDSLVHQWLVEMLRRFNLRFTLLDQARIDALDEDINPFSSAQLIICSLSLLSEHAAICDLAAAAEWDMLVVDEAHHLGWSEAEVSPEYACIERLSAAAPGLLLLTATPEQLGRSGHFARLRLLDPERYPSLRSYQVEEESYIAVGETVEALQALGFGDQADLELMAQLDRDQAEQLAQSDSDAEFERARRHCIRSLLDRHGTGRVLFRNTRDTVAGFPSRRLCPHPLTAPEPYTRAEGAALEQLLHPERLLGEEWVTVDPRVGWLTDWLQQQSGKVLLICAAASTARRLEEHLRTQCGVRSAVFHEGMSLVNRDRAAAYFSDPDYGADILICSEIGSEGRNFQFAHQLVLFDLPLNPDLLEQRIGRLDRIGQRHEVEIHAPHYDHGPQAALLQWLHQGLDAFLTPCALGPTLYAEQQRELTALVAGAEGRQSALETFIEKTREKARTLNDSLRQGRNKLLEMSSCEPERAAEVVARVQDSEQPAELEQYVEALFDHYGIDHQRQGDGRVVVRPSEQMLADCFPELTEEGLTGTYERNMALHREDLEFLSWEHPLVAGAMELVADSEAGNSAVCTLSLPPLKPGSLMLECLFRMRLSAPKALQLQRHLPGASWRVLLNPEGKDLSAALAPDKLNPRLAVVGRDVAAKLVRHTRALVGDLIGSAEQLAVAQQQIWVAQARQSVTDELDAEQARLIALAAVNPNVREAEINHLGERREAMLEALGRAQLQLDALRLIVVT